MTYDEDLLLAAHKASIHHHDAVRRSGVAGCFYCLRTMRSGEISEWVDPQAEQTTALCPYCGIDSVIGDDSGFPVTPEFLKAMQARWFGPAAPNEEE